MLRNFAGETAKVLADTLLAAQKSERELLEACEAALDAIILSQGELFWRRDACINDAQSILEQAIAKVLDK